MSEPIASLMIPQAAKLCGISAVHAWRVARSGRWGPIEFIRGTPARVPIVAIERESGRVFSAAQVEAAARKRVRRRVARLRIDRALLGTIVLGRDVQWRQWLRDDEARRASPAGPSDEEFVHLVRDLLLNQQE
jgi:hypothetical protein